MSKGTGVKKFDCPRCGEPSLSELGHFDCGTQDESPESAVIQKIRKLLAHAEGTTSEGEAANYWQKAQELMQQYAIDEALLAEDPNVKRTDVIVHVVPFVKRQARRARKLELLRVIASANRVRAIDSNWELPPHLKQEYAKVAKWLRDDDMTPEQTKDALKRIQELKQQEGVVYIVGTRADVTFVELLYMSVQMQAWRFLSAAYKEHEVTNTKAAWGNSFLAGFNFRIAQRLREESEKTTKQAQTREDARGKDSGLAVRNVGLALRNTMELVNAKVDEYFGKGGLKMGRGSSGGNDPVGRAAGRAAGDRADLTGGRRGLGSGQRRLT